MLTSSLPKSWKTFVVALNNSNSDEVVSMGLVVSSLLNEKMRMMNIMEGKNKGDMKVEIQLKMSILQGGMTVQTCKDDQINQT